MACLTSYAYMYTNIYTYIHTSYIRMTSGKHVEHVAHVDHGKENYAYTYTHINIYMYIYVHNYIHPYFYTYIHIHIYLRQAH